MARAVQRGYIAMGHLERHDHVPDVHEMPTRSTRTYRDGTLSSSRPCRRCSTPAFNALGWDQLAFRQMRHVHGCRLGTHAKSGGTSKCALCYVTLQTAWYARFTGGTTPSPVRVDAQGQRVRRVPTARQRRRRHLHRHPHERHVLRPGVRRRVRAAGRDIVHQPGTDRSGYVRVGRLPIAPSSRRRWTRASGSAVARVTMPYWDVSRVTDMSFLFQGKTQFNVNIGQWEMSQVTDAHGLFARQPPASTRTYQGWTFARQREHDGDVHGRRHLALPRVSPRWH